MGSAILWLVGNGKGEEEGAGSVVAMARLMAISRCRGLPGRAGVTGQLENQEPLVGGSTAGRGRKPRQEQTGV
jgi:hypothetical protein